VSVSPATSVFASACVPLPYLTFSSLMSLVQPSTCETVALASPELTASWNGELGKGSRSPLDCGSHQICSRHGPASDAE
jgi:hypothetical protein